MKGWKRKKRDSLKRWGGRFLIRKQTWPVEILGKQGTAWIQTGTTVGGFYQKKKNSPSESPLGETGDRNLGEKKGLLVAILNRARERRPGKPGEEARQKAFRAVVPQRTL